MSRSRRDFPAILALAATLPLLSAGGCCTFTRLWCGPDDSRWISRSFRTPKKALSTFLEAIRRDQPKVIYDCLGEDFKRRQNLPGPMHAALGWQKIKEQTPAIHLLGTAAIKPHDPETPDRRSFTLSVSGHLIKIELLRQAFVELRYEEGPGMVVPEGVYVSSLAHHLRTQQASTDFVIQPPPKLGIPADLRVDQIHEITAGHDWKIHVIEEL
ncbi:MAG: hypothetical protein QF412_09635 [Planctomycetota bacterium]|nr:hypothetical protein [Planctomycetota bacterium]